MIDQKLDWNNTFDIDKLAACLKAQGVALGPSDTVIGLFAAVDKQGYDRLNFLKNRSNKPYLVVIDNMKSFYSFSSLNPDKQLMKVMQHFWPGPLTLIVKAKEGVPDYAKSSTGAIALRVPRHEGVLRLLKQFSGLFSTSANKAGGPIPKSLADVDEALLQQVDCIIDDSDKTIKGILPSTILDCTGEHITVVRQGVIPIADIEKVYGSSFS